MIMVVFNESCSLLPTLSIAVKSICPQNSGYDTATGWALSAQPGIPTSANASIEESQYQFVAKKSRFLLKVQG
jgi:hypothetical protein